MFGSGEVSTFDMVDRRLAFFQLFLAVKTVGSMLFGCLFQGVFGAKRPAISATYPIAWYLIRTMQVMEDQTIIGFVVKR